MKHQKDVIFTGRVEQKDVVNYLAASLALCYVSYFEGFGIPILEAYRCEVPVITSNLTAMPEISADAALLVNPFDNDHISEAMIKIYSDEALAKDLIEKSKIQINKYDWKKSAEKFWEIICKSI
jgi:glycosyltransferase involved in cell wall biosynthesis